MNESLRGGAMCSKRAQWQNFADNIPAGSDSPDTPTEEADSDQHIWLRLLVSLIGVVILAYGLWYEYFASSALSLVMSITGIILLVLGGLWGRAAQARWEAEYPNQPEGDSSD